MNAEQMSEVVFFHRKRGGLLRAALAQLAGVGKTVVFDIEKGKLSVRLATLLKVLHVLNVKVAFQSSIISTLQFFRGEGLEIFVLGGVV